MSVSGSIHILPASRVDPGLMFAVDLGGTYLRAAAVDSTGQIISRQKLRTPQNDPLDIVRVVAGALTDGEHATDRIRTLCMVVPGPVDATAGKVVRAPNLPCLDGFDLAAALVDELRLPVIIENDANAAALGELWQGAGRGCRTIICLTLGTGVGGGMVLDGKLWRGATNAAAEIGHMSVEPFGGIRCGCGSRGCLEVYASATAIVRMALDAKPHYPGSRLCTAAGFTAEDVYLSAQQGDQLAIEVFQRLGAYLGIGLANLMNIVNPEMIVIGGGVANAWDLFAGEMRHQVNQRAFPLPGTEVPIVRAQCDDDAGLLGAACLGFGEPAESEAFLPAYSG